MGWYRAWRRRRLIRSRRFPSAVYAQVVADLPVLAGLDSGELQRLCDLCAVFLGEKVFESAQGSVITLEDQIRIALQACLPILNLGIDWYAGWSSLIVYPGSFVASREEIDEFGIAHFRRHSLSGEAWEQGPVILSLDEVQWAGRRDGYNVVIHEMAHKLDMLNGVANGFPPLHSDMAVAAWIEAFTHAFEELVRSGSDASTAVDPYAGESPAEFFAVLSEYFFERPEIVLESYPQVYEQLVRFYRQSPLGRLAPVAQPP